MGEPASGPPPQSNGGVKQKPTTLNLGLGPFYRGASNSPVTNIQSSTSHVINHWVSSEPDSVQRETQLQPPPPPAPANTRNGRSLRNGQSPNHGNYNGHGFPLYTPPAPIPSSGSSSGTGKTRCLSNGIPNPSPRRPNNITVSPLYGHGHKRTESPPPSSPGRTVNEPVLRRPHSAVYAREYDTGSMGAATTPSRHVLPGWNGPVVQQPAIPRRPHSIASTPTNPSVVQLSSTTLPSVPVRTPGEPVQWGPSGLVLHHPVPRRPYSTSQSQVQSQPQPPTPTSMNTVGLTGNCNTWTAGVSLRPRPHSVATTPQGTAMAPASPSDSGYRSLPSSSSDYQLLKSPSQQLSTSQGQQSAVRRLSLPSAQTLLRVTAPKPSPTFHGLPFRPFTCGLSPNGNPIFLGCTHLHGNRVATPVTSPAKSLTTSQAIQQLLAQPRNGFKIVDDKVSLFIEILDTQERFAKVSANDTISWFSKKKKKHKFVVVFQKFYLVILIIYLSPLNPSILCYDCHFNYKSRDPRVPGSKLDLNSVQNCNFFFIHLIHENFRSYNIIEKLTEGNKVFPRRNPRLRR